MTDTSTLPYYVSYAHMAHLECPRFATSVYYKDKNQKVSNGIPPTGQKGSYLNRGFDVDETGGKPLNYVFPFLQRTHDQFFARTPVYALSGIYLFISDKTHEVFQRFSMGKNRLTYLRGDDKPLQTTQGLMPTRGVWCLKINERWPTVVPTKDFHYSKPHNFNPAFKYDNIRSEIENYTILNQQVFNSNEYNWTLPCMKNTPNIDLWTDPFWPRSIFMSEQLVQALEKENLLQGPEYGWYIKPCREATQIEYDNDLVSQENRDIDAQTWARMSLEEFMRFTRNIPQKT